VGEQEFAMPDFDTVLRARRSVRGYLPRPVPDAILAEIFDLAAWAPSNCNIQPWAVHVLSGARLRALGQALVAAAGAPRPDVPMDTAYRGVFRTRQIGAAVALYSALGIGRDDHEGRRAAFLRNLDAFGAPHAAFVFLPEGFGLREASDLGGYAQTLMLAMASRGVASCAQGALSLHPDLVRQHLGLAPGPQLIMGIAFGYEDPDHPANAARTDRAGQGEIVTLHP
jgi:nitroreductase